MWLIFMNVAPLVYAIDAVYTSDWRKLDQHPLPQWYDSAKIGIFVHWGLYSVPAYDSEWFWYKWDRGDERILKFVKQNNINDYASFVKRFTGEYFDPNEWAEFFFKSGAKYVVLTTKHHDGFALFPSSGSPEWNSVEAGPRKDIVDLLSKAVRHNSMKFGVYYSLLEWHNRLYSIGEEKRNGMEYVENVVFPDIKQLIIKYKPSVLWNDGDWDEESYGSWRGEEILAWIYNQNIVKDEIVVNDRWGMEGRNKHGDFFNGDRERFNPRQLLFHKWENAFTLDRGSWGYRKEMDVMPFEELLENVVSTVSCGGNALINVGPTKEGIIPPIFKKLLLQLGNWLKVNGEAIYGTSPWFYQNDKLNPQVWYTCKKKNYDEKRVSDIPKLSDKIQTIYAIFLKWPENGILVISLDNEYIDFHFNIYLVSENHTVQNKSLNYTFAANGVTEVLLPPAVNGIFAQASVLMIAT